MLLILTKYVINALTASDLLRVALRTDSAVTCSRLSNDSSVLAIGLEDGWLVVFDPMTWRIHYQMRVHHNSVRSLAFSQSGTYLITGSENSHVNVWRTDNMTLEIELRSTQIEITGMAVVDGGETVVVNGEYARVYDYTTGKFMKNVKSRTRMRSVNSSLDGVISLDEDDTVTLWDGTMTASAEFIENVTALAVSKDERYIACKTGNRIRVYEIMTEDVVHSYTEPDSVDGLVFGPNESTIAYYKGHTIYSVDLRTHSVSANDVYGIVGLEWA